MYHPLIPDCVPNTVTLDQSIILTGSNMSGKSSLLKTIGINVVAACSIHTCFAEKFVLPRCSLHTVISVSDDINRATSYYLCEARRIKSIIDKCNDSQPNCTDIVLIDEIFKGTNTIERISIADAVIRYLVRRKSMLVIVSTHDIELARSFDRVLEHLPFRRDDGVWKLRFNYKLTPGIEYTRNAISLLRNSDYPEEIITQAERNTQTISMIMNPEPQR